MVSIEEFASMGWFASFQSASLSELLLAQLDHFHFPRHLLCHEAADCGCSVVRALIQSKYQQGNQQLNDSE